MIVQIYSLQTAEEALACAEAGADQIGVLVSRSLDGRYPCEVLPEQAKTIFDALRGKVRRTVLISTDSDPDQILQMVAYLHADVLQLCADYHGNLPFRKRMKEECPWAELMEAIGIRDQSSLAEAEEKAAYSDYLILDSIPANNPGIGAAGITHDWNIDREIIRRLSIPIIEAGGLDSENVRDAIDFLHPWGVDSCTKTSRIENGKIVGKDLEKVRAFCRAAKQ
ncbi:MAG: hypothetical protein ACI4WR_08060 [Bulleidia sp.]